MKIFRRLALPLLAVALTCLAFSDRSTGETPSPPKPDPADLMTRSATSSVETSIDKNGMEIVTTSNTRFIYRTLEFNGFGFPDSYARSLLLQETVETQETPFVDGSVSSVSVKAWMGKGLAPTLPVWSLRQTGDEGGIFDDDTFYRVTQYPITDVGSAYTFYSLITGRKVHDSSSGTLFEIVVPNVDTKFFRYVAYQSRDSVSPPDDCIKDRSVVGVLQYGSSEKAQDRILIRNAKRKEGIDGDTRFAIVTAKYAVKPKAYQGPGLMLWHTDGIASRAALSHFTIHIAFPPGQAYIDLPINHDTINWSHVRHTADVELQEAHSSGSS